MLGHASELSLFTTFKALSQMIKIKNNVLITLETLDAFTSAAPTELSSCHIRSFLLFSYSSGQRSVVVLVHGRISAVV